MSTSSTVYTPSYSGSETESSSGISFSFDDVDPYNSDTSRSTDDEDGWCIDGYGKGWLPRLRTEAKATALSTSTHLTLTQKYENPSQYRTIKNSAYSFPLYPHSTVVSMQCKFKDRLLIGKVEPKPKAKAIFNEAVESGHRAALLQEVTAEVFTVELGKIAPQETVEVQIEIISEIKHDPEQDSIRFVLPRSIGGRYGAAPAGIASSDSSAFLKVEVGILMPEEIRAITNPNQPMTVIYGHLPGEPKRKTADQVNEQIDSRKATVQLVKDSDGFLTADFVLMIQLKRFAKSMPPFALLEQHPTKPGNMAVMASLVPRFCLPLPEATPEVVFVVDLSGSMRGNIPKLRSALEVFLKSLPPGIQFNICFFGNKFRFLFPEGSREYSAETLKLALAETRVVEANMGGTELYGALNQVFEQRHRDIENTEIIVLTDGEIWGPENIFNMIRERRKAAGTDGNGPRVFSLGIGDNVSHHLVEGLAESGGGFPIFAQNNEAFSDKIVKLLTAALSVRITNINVELEFEDGKSRLVSTSTSTAQAQVEAISIATSPARAPAIVKTSKAKEPKKNISLMDSDCDASETEDSVDAPETIQLTQTSKENRSHLRELTLPNPLQSPNDIQSLFPHQRAIIFLLYQQDPTAPPSAAKSIRLTARLSTGDTTEPLSIPITMAENHQNLGNATMIHSLAARSIIKDMEQGKSWLETGDYGISRETDPGRFGEYVAREAERLGMEWGIVSKWTSLVAVELAPITPPEVDQIPTAQVTELADKSESAGAAQQSNDGSRVAETGGSERKATADTAVIAGDGNQPVRVSCVDENLGSGKGSERFKGRLSEQTPETNPPASAPPPTSEQPRGLQTEEIIPGKSSVKKRDFFSPRPSGPGIQTMSCFALPMQDSSSSQVPFAESSISMWNLAAGNPGISVTGTRAISGVVSTDGLDYPKRRPNYSHHMGPVAGSSPRRSAWQPRFTGSGSYSQHERMVVNSSSYSQHERMVVRAAPSAPAMNRASDLISLEYSIDPLTATAAGNEERWEAPDSWSIKSLLADDKGEYDQPMSVGASRTAPAAKARAARRYHQDGSYGSAGKDASPETMKYSAPSPERERDRARFLKACKRSSRAHNDEVEQSKGGEVDLKLLYETNAAAPHVSSLTEEEVSGDYDAYLNDVKVQQNYEAAVNAGAQAGQQSSVDDSTKDTTNPPPTPSAAAPKPSLTRPLNPTSESALLALVNKLISFQEFDGSFNLQTAATAAAFAEEVYNLTGVRLDLTGEPEKDTSVVIKFLTDECAEFEGTWRLVVEKARKWVLVSAGMGHVVE